jgi:nucleoside-diphosphate-sugar epimerase
VRLADSRSEIRFIDWPFPDVELRIPDIDKAQKLIGYKPRVELEDGLMRTIVWYREKLEREARNSETPAP